MEFRSKLEIAAILRAGRITLVGRSVPDQSAHTDHANLGFFLHHFAAPDGGAAMSRCIWSSRKMDAVGALKAASLDEIEESLRRDGIANRIVSLKGSRQRGLEYEVTERTEQGGNIIVRCKRVDAVSEPA